LLALVSFMPVEEETPGIGAMNISEKARKEMAISSKAWTCKSCKMSNESIAKEFMSSDLDDEVKEQEELKKASQTF
jgi:hypothetical protein